jgi:hypothetical protein
MASLSDILAALESADRPISLRELVQSLNIEESALEGMLTMLVNRGRLRVVGPAAGTLCDITGCATCSAAGPISCPKVLHDPRRYEIVRLEIH